MTTLDHRKKGKPVEFFELISACNLFDNNVKKKERRDPGTQRAEVSKFQGVLPSLSVFLIFFRWIHLENLWQRQQEKCIATETTRNCFSRSLKKNGKGSRRETTPTTGDRRTEVQRSTYPEMEMENRTETTIPLDWKKFLKAAFRPIKSYYILINSAADKSQKLWDTLTLDVVDAD